MIRTSLVCFSSVALLSASSLAGCGDGGTSGSSDLTVTPGTADVATCRTKTFTADPADGVTWSLEGAGQIKDGLYTAPLSVPQSPAVTVTATRDGATADAAITLATAFPEASIDAGRAPSDAAAEYVRAVAARGNRVYALVEGHVGASQTGTFRIARSDDGGLTWKAPVLIAGGDRLASIAIDAADEDTVYVTQHALDENAGAQLFLAVSTDGGQTFSSTPLFHGGNGEVQEADVASPAAGVVVVTAPATWQDGNGGQGATLLVWRDTMKGAGFAAIEPFDNGYAGQWSPGLEMRLGDGRLIETNGGRRGPQLSANAKGGVCLVTTDYDINDGDEHDDVMCSSDAGATWSAPVQVATGKPGDIERARVAIGPDGKLVVAAWNAYNDGSIDSIGHTRYAVSTDGGQSFGSPHDHAGVKDPGGNDVAVAGAEVFIDSLGVIWFSRALADAAVQIDKSCDQGETLSGAFTLPIADPHTNGFVFESGAGVFGGASPVTSGETGVAVVRLLQP